MLNPGSFITRNARYHHDAAALIFRDVRISYGELESRTNRLANALRA
jgi:acyl-CoA synthetase (AMP-forming)/AMP-acid ligase II